MLSRGAAIFDWKKRDLKTIFTCSAHHDYYVSNGPFLKETMQNWYEGKAKRRKTFTRFKCAIDVMLGDTNHLGEEVMADGGYLSKEGSQTILKYRSTFFQPGTPFCKAHQLETAELQEKFRNKESVATSGGSSWRPGKGSGGSSQAVTEPDEDWCPDLKSAKGHIRDLAKLFEIPINVMTQDWPQVSQAQKTRKAQEFWRLVKLESSVVHKKAHGDEALDFIVQRQCGKRKAAKESPVLSQLLDNVAEMFCSVGTPLEKRRALSLVALEVPYSTLVGHIPNLSHYYFSEARRFRRRWGPGALVRARHIVRRRWTWQKVAAFVHYIVWHDMEATHRPTGDGRLSTGTAAQKPARRYRQRAERIHRPCSVPRTDFEHL
jgi:hypothetical protein